ncbi:MAG: hypothetical protein IKN56_08475 [Clostridia bacterium]|nr:hypothetical protein [Clostridia bacterium]
MKKYLSLILCILFAFSFASCGSKEPEKNDYIGEGTKTQLKLLVMANLNFFSDTFVDSTLKADESKPIEKDGVKWYRVKDSGFVSYDAFLTALNVVYTPDCVEKILNEYDFYAEIDGKFCIKADAVKSQDNVKWEMDPAFGADISLKGDKIIATYRFIKEKKSKILTFTFVESGGYRLDKFYKLG